MASRIALTPEQTDLQLAPGETAGITFTVTNSGPVVDAFQLSMTNVDPSWCTLASDQISLFPGDAAEVNLQVHPPVGSTLAGSYTFQLLVTSVDAATEYSLATITLTIAPESELVLEIEPQKVVARKGVFTLSLRNEGNIERAVVLHPSDADEILSFAFGEAQVTPIVKGGKRSDPNAPTESFDVATGTAVGETTPASRVATEWTAPGEEAAQGALAMTIPASSLVAIPVTVGPAKRIWFGPERDLRFEIAATPPGIEWEAYQARRIMGELVYRPVFSWWSKMPLVLRRVLAVLFPLLLLGLLLFLLLRPTDNRNPNAVDASATQTALVLNAQATLTALAANSGPNVAATLTAQAANGPNIPATLTAVAAANSGPGGMGPLRILKFDWTTDGSGGLAVTWEVTNALTVTLNSDVVTLVGTKPVDPTSDQAMTLIATNGKETASRSLGVLLLRPPEITSFKAEPELIKPGDGVVVSWEVLRADEILFDGSKVTGPNGSVSLQPRQTEQHILVARNNFGQVQGTVTITVQP